MTATVLLSHKGRDDGGREGGRLPRTVYQRRKLRECDRGEAAKDVPVTYRLSPNSNCFISPTGMCLVSIPTC